jgi:hypothetical protein
MQAESQKQIQQNHAIEFLPLNERVCKLRVRNKYSKIIPIICYAPTEDKEDEVKKQL